MTRRATPETRAEAVERVRAGEDPAEIAKEFSVIEKTVRQWVKRQEDEEEAEELESREGSKGDPLHEHSDAVSEPQTHYMSAGAGYLEVETGDGEPPVRGAEEEVAPEAREAGRNAVEKHGEALENLGRESRSRLINGYPQVSFTLRDAKGVTMKYHYD